MRSRNTNILQGFVLLTGIVYIVIGLSFFASPYRVFKIFSAGSSARAPIVVDYEGSGIAGKAYDGVDMSEDDWLKQIVNDEIISPLYYIFRIFAVFLLVGGLAMIMPLFDPLRYRGLIYYNGLIFPAVAALAVFKFMYSQRAINMEIAAAAGRDGAIWQEGHMVMTALGIIFIILCLLNAAGLVITTKQAHEGKE
ncbi:MAG: hypothetical protein JXA07_07710 [Spirochaetes bacterium]|nr:hypothetical protein [Spirochaetota bacterium]